MTIEMNGNFKIFKFKCKSFVAMILDNFEDTFSFNILAQAIYIQDSTDQKQLMPKYSSSKKPRIQQQINEKIEWMLRERESERERDRERY